MSKTLNYGQHFTASVEADPAPAPGAVHAVVTGPGITVTPNGDNTFGIKATAASTSSSENTITYSAPGYRSVVETVFVASRPDPVLSVRESEVT
jgi:hypothetical protein